LHQECLLILILLIQVISIEIHINLYRTTKFMKFAPKFKLQSLYHGKHLVPPVHGILLRLMTPFFMDQVEALII
jgi:hypothetical protein